MMLGIICFSAKCAEGLLLDLLEDDRFLHKVDAMYQDIQRHFKEISQMPELVWSRCATLVGIEVAEFKHATILSAAATAAYIHRDVFAEFWRRPFSLTQGNILENVRALADDKDIADPVSRQLQALLRAGELESHIADALHLLRSAPFTSTLVEEGHAGATVLMRHHEDYSEGAHSSRALLHQQRPLFRPCPLSNNIAALDRRLAQLNDKHPEKIHSRQAFLKRSVYDERQHLETLSPTARFQQAQEVMKGVVHEDACHDRARAA